MKNPIFWDITPYSPLKVNRRFGGTDYLHSQGRRISQASNQYEAGSKQSPKMEATCSSETLVDFQRTARRYIPQGRTLYNHRCENLKSYVSVYLLFLAISFFCLHFLLLFFLYFIILSPSPLFLLTHLNVFDLNVKR
jgi:hypothetical protein